ncbi:hypothetical protein OkiPb01101_19650 [Escherichia coli]
MLQSRVGAIRHTSPRQFNRNFSWGVEKFCLEDLLYSILIIEPLLNHKKLASTIRCLGIEFDDASYSSDLNKT